LGKKNYKDMKFLRLYEELDIKDVDPFDEDDWDEVG
jgi:hypothetical protein